MSILEIYSKEIQDYQHKGIIIDTGPLLLYIIGTYDQDKIPLFSKTQLHTIEHFSLLKGLIDMFRIVVTTPNILTEACNHLSQLSSPEKEVILSRYLFPYMNYSEEKYSASADLGKLDCFKTFGLADTSIVHCAKGNYLVLTEDRALWSHLRKYEIAVINFNHLCSWLKPN